MTGQSNAGPSFDAVLTLEGYRFPPEARVFVEAYRQSSFMRFAWGTTSHVNPPGNRSLKEFGTAKGVRFRLKVVEPDAEGSDRPARLLGLADRIQPAQMEEGHLAAESILELVPANIDEIWRVNFPPDDAAPVLEVNQSLVPNPNALGRSDPFVSLVLPEVLRAVLTRILIVNAYEDGEEGGDWHAQWLRMARVSLLAEAPPEPKSDDWGALTNRAELEEWIESAVARFARQFHVARRFESWRAEGDTT